MYIHPLIETVYSVEEEEKQKSEEKPDEGPDVTSTDDNEDKASKQTEIRKKEVETVTGEREEAETTEYDISTDDESLRMMFSSTDQVDYFVISTVFCC